MNSRTKQSCSFFPSSSGFEVSGGHFSSSRDHLHTSTGNVFINVNHMQRSGNKETFELEIQKPATSDVEKETSRYLYTLQQESVSTSFESMETDKTHEKKEQSVPVLSKSPGPFITASPLLPMQKSSRIYTQHLCRAGFGYPLWIPEPSSNLPEEYQKVGFGIGDVGILKDSGGFDFLFNIYQPRKDAEHPINPQEMPEGFCPLDPPKEIDLNSHTEFPDQSFLARPEVKSRYDEESLGFIFEASAVDGAILTMPNGANSIDLENTKTMKKYARQNAKSWYTYANSVRGRNARSGDLRLIVGKTLTTAWGMATFASQSEEQTTFLKFKPTSGNNSSSTKYRWEYSGMAEVKSGPSESEVEKLKDFDRSKGEEAPTAYQNQCLFIGTININLDPGAWDKLAATWENEDEDGDEDDTSLSEWNRDPDSYFPFRSSTSTSSSSVFTPAAGQGHGGNSGRTSRQSHDLHPSKIINEYLLRKVPSAEMAITQDSDWISVLRKSDLVFPSAISLLHRIEKRFTTCVEEGAVSLRSREQVGSFHTRPRLKTNNLSADFPEEFSDDSWPTLDLPLELLRPEGKEMKRRAPDADIVNPSKRKKSKSPDYKTRLLKTSSLNLRQSAKSYGSKKTRLSDDEYERYYNDLESEYFY